MFRLQDGYNYKMPVHFGGNKFDPEFVVTQRTTDLTISYETDLAQLENYIPEEFELRAPEITVASHKYTEINWLSGEYYNVITVTAPVRFHGKKDQLDGDYYLVVWENRTAPIIGGREHEGVPKIYADILDLLIQRPLYGTGASCNGQTFLVMWFEATDPISGDELDTIKAQMAYVNGLGWRYIPQLEGPGAEVSQFVIYPSVRKWRRHCKGRAA